MIGIRLYEDRLEMLADFLGAKQWLLPHPIWVFPSILEMPPNPFGLQYQKNGEKTLVMEG